MCFLLRLGCMGKQKVLYFQAYDRLQQRNDKIWDAIKEKSDETDALALKQEEEGRCHKNIK